MADVQALPEQIVATDTETTTPPPRFLRKSVVLARLGISDTTLWRMMRAGKFPKPSPISAGTVGWLESDVNVWIAARAAERG